MGNGVSFYPSTCHPVDRRTFLTMGLGAMTVLAAGAPTRAHADVVQDGAQIIRTHATRAEDPWAIVHGVRAMGREWRIQGDRPAVQFVLSNFLEEQAAGGSRYLAFPLKIEVHPNMWLKTFLEAGVPPEFRFPFKGRPRTLREVIEGARALFRFSATTDRNTLAWSLIALTRTTPPPRGRWANAWGERVELARVVEAGLGALEDASRPIEEAQTRKLPLERQAPVHAFTCGGTHLLYGLLAAAQAGYRVSDHRERLRHQMDLLVYRLEADVDLMTRYYAGLASTVPGTAWYLLDAELKVVGHAMECLHFAERHGLYTLPPAQARRYYAARVLLDSRVHQLRQLDLTPVKQNNYALYQQLVGDTCHAYHGLQLALG